MNGGFIKLHRSMLDWEWYDDINTKVLFLHCLFSACYKDIKWRGQTIERGSFITSLQKLSEETGLSLQNVRTSLKRLESTHELTSRKSTKGTVIQVLNYCKYQDVTHELTNNQHTSNTHLTSIKESKEEKERKEDIFSFFDSLINLGVDKQVAEDWLKVRKTKKATNSQTAFNRIKNEIEKSGYNANECITKCVENDWKGFNHEWYKKPKERVNNNVNYGDYMI